MESAVLLSCELPVPWEQVRTIRKTTKARLAHYGDAISSACAMAAVELIENALKYGEAIDGLPSGCFSLEVRDGEVRIQVRSGCSNPGTVDQVARHLQRIRETEDKSMLFQERAMELFLDDSQSGGLGLYRIAVEGDFELHHEYRDQRLVIVASRRAA